jgi:hypothetical protein
MCVPECVMKQRTPMLSVGCSSAAGEWPRTRRRFRSYA